MPPRGSIDRLFIWYDLQKHKMFCEGTDWRGEAERKGRLNAKGLPFLGWTVGMKKDRNGFVENIDKKQLSDFILDAGGEIVINKGELQKFLDANFHLPSNWDPFEKISSETFFSVEENS